METVMKIVNLLTTGSSFTHRELNYLCLAADIWNFLHTTMYIYLIGEIFWTLLIMYGRNQKIFLMMRTKSDANKGWKLGMQCDAFKWCDDAVCYTSRLKKKFFLSFIEGQIWEL